MDTSLAGDAAEDAGRHEPEPCDILGDGRFIAACVAVLPALGAVWSDRLAWDVMRTAALAGSWGPFQQTGLVAANVPVVVALLLAAALALLRTIALARRGVRATSGAGRAPCLAALLAACAALPFLWALETAAIGSGNGALEAIPDHAPMTVAMPGIMGLAVAVAAVLALLLSPPGATRRPVTPGEAIAWPVMAALFAGIAATFGLREMPEQLDADAGFFIDTGTLIVAAAWWLACGLLLRRALQRRRDLALVSLVAAAVIMGLNDRIAWLDDVLVDFRYQQEDLHYLLIAIAFVAVRVAFWAGTCALVLRPASLQRTLTKATVATAASFIVDVALGMFWWWIHVSSQESLYSWPMS